MTFQLLYATDFADRLEKEIIPALKAGFIVLSDRYIFTALARAGVRGVDRHWIRQLYGFGIAPHLVFYLRIDEKTLIRRVLQSRGMDYWESGMDLKLGDDIDDEADFVTCSRFKDPELYPVMPRVKYWGNWKNTAPSFCSPSTT